MSVVVVVTRVVVAVVARTRVHRLKSANNLLDSYFVAIDKKVWFG
jgi:hypothetical protein